MKLKNNLIKKIWLYLIIFSITILSFLWFLQVIFLGTYYVWVKSKDIDKVTNQIVKKYNSENYEETFDNLTYQKDMCISVMLGNTEVYSSSGFNKSCFSGNENNLVYEKFKLEFMNSGKNSAKYRIIDKRFENQILIKAVKLDNYYYAFVSTSLQPIGSTVSILTSQLIYVTVLVLLLSFFISYFISKRISKPIVKISNDAKKMAKGDYSVSFVTDSNISEIVELSNTLEEAREELSKTDEIRRELMANISHDLKTPLTMIKAYAEMVRDLTFDDKEKSTEHLNTIINETDRLNLLVNDILELSKMQSNQIKLNKEVFDLNELIKSLIEKFNYLNDYKFIYQNQKKLMVYADKKQIEQVLYNLISNAIKYGGDKKVVKIKIIDQKNTYKVDIIDEGPGIPKEDLDLIWDKYYRTDKTHQRSNTGTGLGLSIVKSILVKHKFDYGVKSTINKGSTFYFQIDKKS